MTTSLIPDIWNIVLSYAPDMGVEAIKQAKEKERCDALVVFQQAAPKNPDVNLFLENYVKAATAYFLVVLDKRVDLIKNQSVFSLFFGSPTPAPEPIDRNCMAMKLHRGEGADPWKAYDDITTIITKNAPFFTALFSSPRFNGSKDCQTEIGYGYLRQKKSLLRAQSLPMQFNLETFSEQQAHTTLSEIALAKLLKEHKILPSTAMKAHALQDSRLQISEIL
jgi:hypothetical protein